MFTRRLLAGVLAILLCFAFVACTNTNPTDDTTTGTSDSKSTSATTAGSTSDSTTEGTTTESSDGSTTESTSANPPVTPPPTPATYEDLESMKVGKHVTLRYNANAVDISASAKKGVGSKETVTITVTPKNGYIFDGFSEGNATVNGSAVVSTETTYQFTAEKEVTVFANSSFALTYHANGGQFQNGFTGTDTFSAAFFLNPNTLHENGSITREGYTLVGYNTKEDGTGEYVSLGARVTSNCKGAIDLWCVWEENTPVDQFTYTITGNAVTITKYNGTAETVTIPETIDGKTVVEIAANTFLDNSTVKKIIIAKTVQTISFNTCNNCSALETVVLFDDDLQSMSDNAFANCPALKTIHINTVHTLTNEWFSCGAGKFDRLMWAKDMKKIIIIGGSGSLYGYDCAVIDEALGGEYEIINLGENANITALMYFDIVEEFISEGDIVLWCPEPGDWTLGSDNCTRRFWDFRKSDYGVMQYLNLSYYSNFFSSFATNCKTLASAKFRDFDSLSPNMSKYGDDLSDRKSQGNHYSYSFDYYLWEEEALNELFGNITSKGGKIFFSFAAMENTSSINELDISWYEEMILALPGVVSISDYKNCLYDYTYFSDSAWHLTDEGATLRSEHVAADLLKALGKNN